MKILYTNFQQTDGGGHVTYIMSLIKELHNKVNVSVATPGSSRLFKYSSATPNVMVHDQRFTSRIQNMIPEIKALRSLIHNNKYDIIHINGSADHRHIMFACMGIKNRPKLVFTKHNDHSVSSLGNRLRALWGTDYSIAVSDYVKSLMLDSPYRRKPLTTIRHGIDTSYFSPVEQQEKNNLRRLLFGEYHNDLIIFGSSGGTDYDKGWLDLVAALSMLPSETKRKFRVLVAGSMPNKEKMAHVNNLNMQDYVVFPGLVDDVRPLLAACDIGFVLSYREALSYACREVMALGLPTLISNVGGLPENVSDGKDGWIVPARSPYAIVPLLKKIANEPELILSMGNSAREKAVTDFAIRPFVDNTFAVYESVMASGKGIITP